MMKAEEALALANKYTDEHGGGGGGTRDYSQLTNKPQVNGVILVGNKTTEDLIPIGDGLEFNEDGELEAEGGSDIVVIEGSLTIRNDIPTKITFQKTLRALYEEIDSALQSGKLVIIKGERTSDGYHGIIFRLVEEYGRTTRNTHIFEAVCLDSSDGQYIATFRIRDNEADLYTGIKATIIASEGTTDYTDLENQPQINGVTLIGNKTTSDLGIESGESGIAITNANTLGVQNKQLLKLTIDRLKELNTMGTWSGNEYTHRGVKFTVDVNNGNVESITANGTTTGLSTFLVDTIAAQPNTKYIVNGGCIDPDYEEGQQHNFYVQVGSQYIYDEEDYEVETDSDFLSYSIYVQGTADYAGFVPMIRTVGNHNFAPYKPTVNTKVNGLDTRVQILENGGDRSLNYSTSEQVVGTWIDGKPLYQKTFHIEPTFTEQSRAYTVQTGLTNVDEVVGYDEVGMINQALRSLPMFNNSGQLLLKSQYRPQADEIEVYCAASTIATDVYPYVDITMRYTKTTD